MVKQRRHHFARPCLSDVPLLSLLALVLGSLWIQTLFVGNHSAGVAAVIDASKPVLDQCCRHGPEEGRKASIFATPLNYSLSFPVYYINMDTSVARRERVTLDFGNIWDLRRSPAVDGSNHTRVLGLMGQNNYDRVAPSLNEDRSPNTINHAELGCILSHLATIRRAYMEGNSLAMIIEDDIAPSLMPFWIVSVQDLVTEAERLEAFEGNPWDIIQLGWIWGLNEELYDNIEERLGHQLVPQRLQFGTSAYIISRPGMEKVMDAHFSDRTPQGLMQLQEGGRQAELYVAAASNVLVTVPSLFTIEGSDTTISTGEEGARRLRSHRESNAIHTKAMLDLFRHAKRHPRTESGPE